MGQSLRILIIEDSQDDVILLQHALRSAGYTVTCEVVDTKSAMRSALESHSWDIITSDHSMPQFSAPAALALAKEICPDVPFIILSGEIDLNLAVSLMRGGAKDYIQKRELVRLVPAIERELQEAQLRRERQRVDAALIESDERFQEVLENSMDASYKRNILTNTYEYLSPVYTRITGYRPDEVNTLPLETVSTLIHPDDLTQLKRMLDEFISGNAGTDYQLEYRIKHKKGHYIWLQDKFTVMRDVNARPVALIGSVSDITERKRMEEALHESKELLSLFMHHSPIFTYIKKVTPAESRVVLASENFDQMIGISGREMTGKTMSELFPPEFAAKITADDWSVVAKGQVLKLNEELNGRSYTTIKFPIRQGENTLLAGYTIDITESKRANAELEALLEIMQAFVVTKDLGEILAMVHRAVGKVIYAENFFVVFFNKETGLFEEVYSVDKYDPPAPPSRLEKSITAYIYRTGKPQIVTQTLFNDLEAQGEVEMVGTNSASWLGAPLVTTDGTIGVIVVQDYETPDRYAEVDKNFLAYVGSQVALALERKQAEAALLESEQKYKLLHESAGVGIGYYTPDGKVISFNLLAASHMGGKPEDFAGKSIYELFPSTVADVYIERISKAAASQEIQEYVDKVDLPGEPRWFVSTFTRILNSANQVIGVQIISTDISNSKQAEEQIQRLNSELELRVADRTVQLTAANQELQAFSYSVSHDLRAPLRALEGFSAILMSDYQEQLDEQGQHYLARIREASRRMGQLIEDLLNLSRITHVVFSRQQVDLSALANQVAVELTGQSPQRCVEFEITSQMIVQGDENLLKIVLENLMNNAFKFTSRCEKAVIQVGSMDGRTERVYFVRDNGAGFNMDYTHKLFGPFQRLHNANEYPGIGIGLATVQRIIHRHGGRVWAEGVENKGATFYFTTGT